MEFILKALIVQDILWLYYTEPGSMLKNAEDFQTNPFYFKSCSGRVNKNQDFDYNPTDKSKIRSTTQYFEQGC